MNVLDMLVKSVEEGWWEAGADCKRWKAVSRVFLTLSMMNDCEGVIIPEVMFFAPELNTLGFATGHLTLPKDMAFIYLSPLLEFESLKDVAHTVAHELAHVFLGDHVGGYVKGVEYAQQPKELSANKLAAEWGFPKRQRGKGEFAVIVDQFIERRDARAAKRAERPRKQYVYRCTECGWEEAFDGKAGKRKHGRGRGRRVCVMCCASQCQYCGYSYDKEMLQRLSSWAESYGHKSKCFRCDERQRTMVRFYTMVFLDNDVEAMRARINTKEEEAI